jgi:hypothetical protein
VFELDHVLRRGHPVAAMLSVLQRITRIILRPVFSLLRKSSWHTSLVVYRRADLNWNKMRLIPI